VETILHVTHWKAGSTWIRRILRQLAPDRFVRPARGWDPFPTPVPAGAVYSCFATREQVEEAGLIDQARLVVVRDLRDTLVSAYFSFRDTHRPSPIIEPLRSALLELDQEEGMLLLLERFLPRCAAIHTSWAGEPVIRYEDLLRDDVAILSRALNEDCGLDLDPTEVERVILSNRFRRITGRSRGEEATDHLRKGVAGDWRNHFTDRINEEFNERFGQLV
jgi:Sulfotransferase domain